MTIKLLHYNTLETANMQFRRGIVALGLAAILAFGGVKALAQGIITGSVSGTVADKTGAVLPGATITLKNKATGVVTTSVADKSGIFDVTNLPVGTYSVAISNPGFGTSTLDGVVVDANKITSLGSNQLALGGTSTQVEVSTAVAQLETVQSQVTTTFDSLQVENLPTGGGFDELALLIPGVVSTHGNNRANTNGAGISSNGQRGRSNNFELDGQSNNDNSVTGPQIFFSNEEALDQVQIITNNFGAQYGRDAGSVINYVTKSGTNSFHGSAIYRYEGAWLSSLTQGQKSPYLGFCPPGQTLGCVPVVKPRFTNNQFGGSLGGPILKDKLWGFGSAFFIQNYQGVTTSVSGTATGTTGFIPTAAGLATLQATYPNNAGVQSLSKYGPQAINLGNFQYILPANARTILVSDGTTSVSIPVQQYARSINPHSTDEEVLGRLDYQATSKDRFYARYFYQNDPSFLASGTVTTGGIVNVTDISHSIGADWTHTFGPRVVNQVRYSFQQATVNFDGGAFPSCTVKSFGSCPSSFGAVTSSAYKVGPTGLSSTGVSLSSFGLSTSYPQGRTVKVTQIQDNVTLTLGKHAITLGGEWSYQNSPNVFLPNISGGFSIYGFDSLLGNSALPQALGLAIGNPQVHFTEPDAALYFQDDWHVTPSLTVNMGLRWEFFSQSINLLHDLTVANQTGPNPLWSTALPLSTTTFPYIPQDYKHFEPRVGFAYNPTAIPSLVIRGGYAINIAPAYYNIFLNSYGSAPVVLSNTITGCNNSTKVCIPTGGANYTSVHAADNGYLQPTGTTSTLNPGAFSQTFVGSNFRQPITQTYSLGVQKQFAGIGVAEVRYVGAHTVGDFQSVNANPAIGFAVQAFPTYFGSTSYCTTTTALGYNGGNGRPNCNATNVRTRQNTSFEIYNGLQTSFQTKNYKGLTANLAYTWSRTIDNASEIFGTFGAGATNAFSQNPLDPNIGERGVSGQSYPNVTSLSVVYEEPYFKNSRTLKGYLLGGYQLNSIYIFNSGQPYTPYQLLEGSFCDSSFNTAFGSSVDSCRPILSNPNAPLNSVGINVATTNSTHSTLTSPVTYVDVATGNTVARSSEHWLINNYAEALTLGNPYPGVGRNTLRGNTYNNVDLSFFKNIPVREGIRAQLNLYVYNALNRAYYGAPDPAVEDAASTFTSYAGNGGSNRNVQIGAKILF